MGVSPLEIGLAIAVGIVSIARLTRLFTQDTWPPVAWLRSKWDNALTRVSPEGEVKVSGWIDFLHCPYCLAVWLTVPIGLWGWLTNLQPAWWVFNGWLAAAYVASMVVQRDGE